MKIIKIFLLIILFFILVSVFIYYYYFIWQKVIIYKEFKLYTSDKMMGLAWSIITNKDIADTIEKIYTIDLPNNNYKKYFLCISNGRRIKEIKYKRISKFTWQYKGVYLGKETFKGKVYEHTMFVYKINKVEIKQEGD